MRICTCAKCGRVMNDNEDVIYTINKGTNREYVECETCHEAEWDDSKIDVCAGCGEWFTMDVLHSEKLTPRDTFCPCPSCGKDFVEGTTREEILAEADRYIPRYSVVVQNGDGNSRGYVISAENRPQAIMKLSEHTDLSFAVSIYIAEILLDTDEF